MNDERRLPAPPATFNLSASEGSSEIDRREVVARIVYLREALEAVPTTGTTPQTRIGSRSSPAPSTHSNANAPRKRRRRDATARRVRRGSAGRRPATHRSHERGCRARQPRSSRRRLGAPQSGCRTCRCRSFRPFEQAERRRSSRPKAYDVTEPLLAAAEVAELLAVPGRSACKRSVRGRFRPCQRERLSVDARGRASVRRLGTNGDPRPAMGVPVWRGGHAAMRRRPVRGRGDLTARRAARPRSLSHGWTGSGV